MRTDVNAHALSLLVGLGVSVQLVLRAGRFVLAVIRQSLLRHVQHVPLYSERIREGKEERVLRENQYR